MNTGKSKDDQSAVKVRRFVVFARIPATRIDAVVVYPLNDWAKISAS
jgi:hypothetical protein